MKMAARGQPEKQSRPPLQTGKVTVSAPFAQPIDKCSGTGKAYFPVREVASARLPCNHSRQNNVAALEMRLSVLGSSQLKFFEKSRLTLRHAFDAPSQMNHFRKREHQTASPQTGWI